VKYQFDSLTEPHVTDAATRIETPRTTRAAGTRLGERLRQLRVAAGLTQTELAGARFSKEYVSQIERGKTRPTRETIDWLAARLGVDPGFLGSGVSTDERGRVEATLARAEALSEANRLDDAVTEFEKARTAVAATGAIELEVRALAGEAWVRQERGEVREAIDLLMRARELAESPSFSDVDRADVLFRLGVCRIRLSSVTTAIALFNEALALAERSELPCDSLRSEILHWRSRCYRRQRDLEAAREDIERALELAQAVENRRSMANVYFQASLVAERMGHWLRARNYAERARALYEELNDEKNVGRLLNNLGGLNHLLGKSDRAVEYLKASFSVALEVDSKEDAAQAASSLARVQLERGDNEQADQLARHALELLEGHEERVQEIGDSELILGRALLEQGRLDEAEERFRRADGSFEQFASVSHRAEVWVAMGDLAARRADDATAARWYRKAAEALQDVRF
jgi:tetratricopeptide (TPR) repeat protein